ncbi:glycoside hydrolase family 5 protein [Oribacterium sp. WCC10]|uniref:glycoside hydrolase family 5 protein n=1 Tax=Oribacterium sp. WCC10 TaxID=1855343 RepID=UPI0008F11266|nr:glycoside hydrolase family 5 protein [Oribacterium sp. WCC10]SFG75222.1 endoglucanase [Oribacterium sp. WCC10]
MNKRSASLLIVILFIVVLSVGYLIFGGKIKRIYEMEQNMKFVKSLGAGINIGNDLDVYNIRGYIENPSIYDYETAWGNPPAERNTFAAVKSSGFNTVRLPVTWSEHLDSDGNIDDEWMKRVKEVVDTALSENLFVIIDTHHEAFIIPTYEKEAETTEKLVKIWKQIAENFNDYDERLMFEGMNEPRLIGSDEEWTDGTKELRTVVNRLNSAFIKTVRETGGNNKKRVLFICAYGSNYRTHALQELEIPDDTHIAVSVHAYLPYKFIDASQGKNKWKEDQESYTSKILELKDTIQRCFLSNRIPVVITEFGCEEKESEEERIKWADYYLRQFSEIEVPCIWWDNGDEYGVFDRKTGEITHEELVNRLVR